MNALPIQSTNWREDFKKRVQMEQAILRTLIQWGLTECCSDLMRTLDSFAPDVADALLRVSPSASFRMSSDQRIVIGEILRNAYRKTRSFPRRDSCQELLHDALLGGFDDLTGQLIRPFENFIQQSERSQVKDRAA